MTTMTRQSIEAGTWNADPVHSRAGFRVRHFGLAWLRGSFDDLDGIRVDVGEDGRISITGDVPVASISFTNPQLHGHLQSPDFFDAQLHPRLTFRSADVVLGDDGTVEAQGELTMKGITRPIELRGSWSSPVEGLGGERRFGLELAGELDRFDYGIAWSAALPGGADVVGRTVRLEGEFELVKA